MADNNAPTPEELKEKALKEAELLEKRKLKAAINVPAEDSVFKGIKFKAPERKERKFYHVATEKPIYKEGTKLSKPAVRVFTKRAFDMFVANAKSLGFTYEVLFDPTEYEKAQ